MYATGDLIAEAKAEIKNFKKPQHMSAVRYLKVFWEKASRCGRVIEEARLRGFLLKDCMSYSDAQ